MKTVETINLFASIVIFLASLYLLFQYYGTSKSELEKQLNRFEYFLVKIGLIVMSMGTLWNILDVKNMPSSQVLLNVGLAFYMFWNGVKLSRTFKRKANISNNAKTIDPKGEDYPDDPK